MVNDTGNAAQLISNGSRTVLEGMEVYREAFGAGAIQESFGADDGKNGGENGGEMQKTWNLFCKTPQLCGIFAIFAADTIENVGPLSWDSRSFIEGVGAARTAQILCRRPFYFAKF